MPEETTPPSPEAALEQTLKRCRPEVVQAARDYQSTKNAELLPTIVLGVLERFIEPERRDYLKVKDPSELKLQADLGMDSLVMVEVVMTLEEVLGQQIPDTELRGLFTIGDTLAYVKAKATGTALPIPPDRLIAEMLPMLLPNEVVLISDVILRENRAEAVYSCTDVSAQALMNAAKQLASVWLQRKNLSEALSPKISAPTLEVEAGKPVQLRLEKAAAWSAYYLQTGKSAVLLGSL
jgi:acyl carrier protein